MPTRSEQIVSAVETLLKTPPMSNVPAARVLRDMRGALQSALLPAIVLETGDEPAPNLPAVGVANRRVPVRLVVLGQGTGYTAVDAAHLEAAERILGAPTLSGLAMNVEEGPIQREQADGDTARFAVMHTFVYQYRTTDRSIA
jgi:hypothetical protein